MGRKRVLSASDKKVTPTKRKSEKSEELNVKDTKTEKLKPCSYGLMIKEEDKCHSTSFTKKHCLHVVGDLTKQNRDIFLMRTNIKIIKRDETICDHHLQKVMVFYPLNQVVCCDPYKCHRMKIRNNLKEILLKDVTLFREKGITSIKPGQKLCSNCFAKVKYSKTVESSSDSESSESESHTNENTKE